MAQTSQMIKKLATTHVNKKRHTIGVKKAAPQFQQQQSVGGIRQINVHRGASPRSTDFGERSIDRPTTSSSVKARSSLRSKKPEMSAKKKPMKRTTMGHRSEASQGAELSAAEEEEAILDRER